MDARSVGVRGSGYGGVCAANQDVADSQQMIEEISCHMRSEMAAQNTGEHRRCECVVISQPSNFYPFPKIVKSKDLSTTNTSGI